MKSNKGVKLKDKTQLFKVILNNYYPNVSDLTFKKRKSVFMMYHGLNAIERYLPLKTFNNILLTYLELKMNGEEIIDARKRVKNANSR